MGKITGNEPAHPVSAELLRLDEMGHLNNAGAKSPFGLTVRQEFAKAAIQGLLANPQVKGEWGLIHIEPQTWAMKAFQIADAMIAESNREAQ